MAKTVLVVEDNALNMKLFCAVLEARGLQTVGALDGRSGLSLARERRPDLILLDIQLPDISGLEVVRQLREDESLKHIPVIAVTAFALGGDAERVLAAGCDAYIPKPIQIPEFVAIVEKFLAEPA